MKPARAEVVSHLDRRRARGLWARRSAG